MFVKCAYLFDLIEKLDIPNGQKMLIESEINCLINLLMFGDERRTICKYTQGEVYNKGETKKW